MLPNFSDLEMAQEAANFHACSNAFEQAYPGLDPAISEECDDGEFICPTCPFRAKGVCHG
jgi:hypothetical protein